MHLILHEDLSIFPACLELFFCIIGSKKQNLWVLDAVHLMAHCLDFPITSNGNLAIWLKCCLLGLCTAKLIFFLKVKKYIRTM